MKKKIIFMLIIAMFVFMLTGCSENEIVPGNSTEQVDSTGSNGIATNEDIKYYGTGYESTDDPNVVEYISEPSADFPVTNQPNTLTVGNAGEPVNLYPYAANQNPATAVINQIYETLIKYNQFTKEYEGNLAESWEYKDDETLRLYLRKDVVSHSGNKFTASDVLWSAQQGKVGTQSSHVWGLLDVDNFEIIDDYTIDIKTFGAFGPLFAYLSHTSVGYMIDQKAYEAQEPDDYLRNPTGGHGPYKFVEWIAGDRIVLERFDDYYGEKPYFEKIIIRNISDDVTRALSLESGDLDFITMVDSSSVQMLVDSPNANVITYPSFQLIHMAFNMEKEPFDNVLVRKALRHALDLESMVELSYDGMAEVADGPWPNSLSAYRPNMNPNTAYEYDIEKAKVLLEEAGYPNGFEFDLWVADTNAWVQMAEMIQNAYSKIGVKANVQVMDQNTLFAERAEGKHEAYIARFSCTGDDAAFWNMRFCSNFGYDRNPTQYKNPRVDQLFEEAANSIDQNYRQERYTEFQDIFREDVIWQSLATPKIIMGIRSTLKGVSPDYYGTPDLRYIRPITVE